MPEPRKSVVAMIAEAIREIGTLALLFIPLDYAFEKDTTEAGYWKMIAMFLFGGVLLAAGISLERNRPILEEDEEAEE